MIDEKDRAEIAKVLAMKKHFESRLLLPKQYKEKITSVTTNAKKVYDKYKNGKAIVDKTVDLLNLIK